jgi:hypothetical protein
MMERFRFSKPLSKVERPKVTNKNFWWTSNNNNDSIEVTLNDKSENENLIDTSSDQFLLSESYEKYMESESKDIAKLHDKLNKLRMQLHSNINESDDKNKSELNHNLARERSNSGEVSNTSDEELCSSNSEIIVSKTTNNPSLNRQEFPKLNNQRFDKLPLNHHSAKTSRENNFNIESLDIKTRNLIDRR